MGTRTSDDFAIDDISGLHNRAVSAGNKLTFEELKFVSTAIRCFQPNNYYHRINTIQEITEPNDKKVYTKLVLTKHTKITFNNEGPSSIAAQQISISSSCLSPPVILSPIVPCSFRDTSTKIKFASDVLSKWIDQSPNEFISQLPKRRFPRAREAGFINLKIDVTKTTTTTPFQFNTPYHGLVITTH